MMALLGVMGVLMAGAAMPFAFGGDDNAEAEDSDNTSDSTAATETETLTPPEDDETGAEDDVLAEPVEDEGLAGLSSAEGDTAPEDDFLPADDIEGHSFTGGGGSDTMDGSHVDDLAKGRGGNDLLIGNGGDDTLNGGRGFDKLRAGPGDDIILGGRGNDHQAGDDGDDRLRDGRGESDTLEGGDGDDTLDARQQSKARDGRDFLFGGAGDDQIHVSEMDYVEGGNGSDTFFVETDVATSKQSEIVDFDPEEDNLVVVWDDQAGAPPPEITLGAIEDAPDMAQVLVDGRVIAHVSGARDLNIEDIELRPVSLVG